jgi:hypothetical protein
MGRGFITSVRGRCGGADGQPDNAAYTIIGVLLRLRFRSPEPYDAEFWVPINTS